MHISEATIHTEDGAALLWSVRGIIGCLYPTKIAAEVAARMRFPNESPAQRYARLSYATYIPENQE